LIIIDTLPFTARRCTVIPNVSNRLVDLLPYLQVENQLTSGSSIFCASVRNVFLPAFKAYGNDDWAASLPIETMIGGVHPQVRARFY
jgi:hypothetical protein